LKFSDGAFYALPRMLLGLLSGESAPEEFGVDSEAEAVHNPLPLAMNVAIGDNNSQPPGFDFKSGRDALLVALSVGCAVSPGWSSHS
jgi:hypothetical protein